MYKANREWKYYHKIFDFDLLNEKLGMNRKEFDQVMSSFRISNNKHGIFNFAFSPIAISNLQLKTLHKAYGNSGIFLGE
jgi:hypothetical protein